MTNPIQDQVGGKYYRSSGLQHVFRKSFIALVVLWTILILTVSSATYISSFAFTSFYVSGAILSITSLTAALFASRTTADFLYGGVYDLIRIAPLDRDKIWNGLLTGMVLRFSRVIGFPLSAVTIASFLAVIVAFVDDGSVGILLMPVLGMVGLCYLGLLGGILSSLLVKNKLAAHVLALSSQFVVVTLWYFNALLFEGNAIIFLDRSDTISSNWRVIQIVIILDMIPIVLMIIPLTLSKKLVRRI